MATTYEIRTLSWDEYHAVDDMAAWAKDQGLRLLSVMMDAATMTAVVILAQDAE